MNPVGTEFANLAIELLKTHKFFVQQHNGSVNNTDETVTLYLDDVKDIYQCFFDYQHRLLKLQELLEREIKLTEKRYSVKPSGILDQEALINAIALIKNNHHLSEQSQGRR